MDLQLILVFLSAFLGFFASYLVEKIVSQENRKKNSRIAMKWVFNELQDNCKLLEDALTRDKTKLYHDLFFDHHWQSAIAGGHLWTNTQKELLAEISAVYREFRDIENWTSILIELYFSELSKAKESFEIIRLTEFINNRRNSTLSDARGLLSKLGDIA